MYVIAGVSGNTGSVAANALLEQGKKVRVVVRDAAKGEAWKARGAEIAVAAAEDEEGLTKALEGASGAYFISPPDVTATDLLGARRETSEVLARAVVRSKVGHVVFLSSVGAQHPTGTGPIRTVHSAEESLARTPAKLTFIRAAYFLENWGAVLGAAAQGALPTFLPPDLSIPMVATKDIGLVAAKALLEGPPAAKIDVIELSGPREYTSREIAGVLAKLLGKPVEVAAAPLDAVVPTFTSFGVSAHVAGLFREMYEGLASGHVAFERAARGARAVRGQSDAAAVLGALLAK